MDFAERRRRPSQRQAVVKASNLQHEDLDKVISICCAQVCCWSLHCTVRGLVIKQVFCTNANVSCSLSEGGRKYTSCVHCSSAPHLALGSCCRSCVPPCAAIGGVLADLLAQRRCHARPVAAAVCPPLVPSLGAPSLQNSKAQASWSHACLQQHRQLFSSPCHYGLCCRTPSAQLCLASRSPHGSLL